MASTKDLAIKMMRKLENHGFVKPGTFRVIIDIDIINGHQHIHSFGKDDGRAAKELIDKVYSMLCRYTLPNESGKPTTATKNAPNPAKKG